MLQNSLARIPISPRTVQIGDCCGEQSSLTIRCSIVGLEEIADFTQAELSEGFNLPLRCLGRLPGRSGFCEGVSEANAGAWRFFFPFVGERQGLI
jgi:hypothetical protein